MIILHVTVLSYGTWLVINLTKCPLLSKLGPLLMILWAVPMLVTLTLEDCVLSIQPCLLFLWLEDVLAKCSFFPSCGEHLTWILFFITLLILSEGLKVTFILSLGPAPSNQLSGSPFFQIPWADLKTNIYPHLPVGTKYFQKDILKKLRFYQPSRLSIEFI